MERAGPGSGSPDIYEEQSRQHIPGDLRTPASCGSGSAHTGSSRSTRQHFPTHHNATLAILPRVRGGLPGLRTGHGSHAQQVYDAGRGRGLRSNTPPGRQVRYVLGAMEVCVDYATGDSAGSGCVAGGAVFVEKNIGCTLEKQRDFYSLAEKGMEVTPLWLREDPRRLCWNMSALPPMRTSSPSAVTDTLESAAKLISTPSHFMLSRGVRQMEEERLAGSKITYHVCFLFDQNL